MKPWIKLGCIGALASTPAIAQECSVEPPETAVVIEPYIGDCKNGRAHGRGQYTYRIEKSGLLLSRTFTVKVVGEFVGGKLNGSGTTEDSTGNKYVGAFLNNEREGSGRLDFESSSMVRFHQGVFKSGRFWEGFGLAKTGLGEVDFVYKEGKQVPCKDKDPAPLCLELLPKEVLEQRMRAQQTRAEEAARRRELMADRQRQVNSPSQVQEPAAGKRQLRRDQGKPEQEFNWDSWLEATGAVAKVGATIPPSAVTIKGNPPTRVETVIQQCQSLVNVIPGPGVGAIYTIEYLPEVEAKLVFGAMGPQGALTPVKLYARYRDGENLYTKAYLQKDPFGDFKCHRAP